MPTLEQLKEFLTSQGIPLPPDFVLTAWLDMVAVIQPCLDGQGYTAAQQILIYLNLLTLFGIANSDKYISSQTAPSGASQSYRYRSMGDAYSATLGQLEALDKSGCTDDLVPSYGPKAGLWVSNGGGCQ